MMKERELAFAGAHSCSWYACRGGTHAVEQLQQRAEVVGSAPLVVGCGDDAMQCNVRLYLIIHIFEKTYKQIYPC